MPKKSITIVVTFLLAISLSACSGSLKIEMPNLEELPIENEQGAVAPINEPDGQELEELPPAPSPAEPLNLDNLANLQNAYINIYEKVLPSIVSIRAIRMVSGTGLEIPEIPFDFDFDTPGDEETFLYPESASGSGFVWDTEGHIITNYHVIEGGDTIRVDFADGRSVLAEVIGADADSDLAVLMVDLPSGDLVPISLADSTQVKVGQIAVAIGNPFNLKSSMTTGIVSGIGRSLPIGAYDNSGLYYSIPDVIQTDAAINPGNSGGVLVDINGGLIGVTTAIESPIRANSGVGYVIPSVIVKKIVPLLIRDGKFEQPWIGISGHDLTPEYAKLMDLDSAQRGALVQDVQPDSPALAAGLIGSSNEGEIDGIPATFGGDVIIAADGDVVNDFEDLVAFLARNTIVGQKITLTIIRNGKNRDIELTLAARPNGRQVEEEAIPEPEEIAKSAWLGISGVDMTAEISAAMDLPEDTIGVLISTVTANSPAVDAELRGSFKPTEINGQEMMVGGDIIIRVNGETIDGMEALKNIIAESEPGDTLRLSVLRDDRVLRIGVTLGEFSE